MSQQPSASGESFASTLNHLTGIGFRVRMLMPADSPQLAVLQGHGLTVRLESADTAPAPGDGPAELPPLAEEFVLSRAPIGDETDDQFGEGRAGMRYRDLIPGRLGGRFIASHILIPEGGPVPDYVHFHRVAFQLIVCHRGWVKVAYEDQGEPLVMHEGDCVLQPATIRHRVLEASDRMQVVEVGCPAEHETWADPDLQLPTGRLLPERAFGPDGHRFVHHIAADAEWAASTLAGYESSNTGIDTATAGAASVQVHRPTNSAPPVQCLHDGQFLFHFVLVGEVTLQRAGDDPMRLAEGDSFVVPADVPFTLSNPSADLRLLDVRMPDPA